MHASLNHLNLVTGEVTPNYSIWRVQVQQGVVEATREQLIRPPQDRDSAVAAKLRLVGAELIQTVREPAPLPQLTVNTFAN